MTLIFDPLQKPKSLLRNELFINQSIIIRGSLTSVIKQTYFKSWWRLHFTSYM